RALLDARIEALLEHARGLFLGKRDHARDEVAARHRARVERHQLIEEEHGETPLLLLGLRRGRGNDGWNMRLGPRSNGEAAAPLRCPSRELRGWLGLVDLRVVRAQCGACPARLRD